ncbi:hypothetical protein LTR64_005639 [Lithohypha guttulata]|uniref:uncharacterized protein n=1 Tax=Lithohypha guttulata TaxID=1690604 RepID=UPI002DDE180A|nr:hypothetical protein LTR51_002567 [Lithohypha guttulata]
MKIFLALFATVHFLSFLVTAHPFVIVKPQITQGAVRYPQTTNHHYKRQGLLDSLESAANSLLGVGGQTTTSSSKKNEKTTSSASLKTLVAPAVASTTISTQSPRTTSTKDSDDDDHHDNNEPSTSTESSTSTTDVSATTTESSTTTQSESTISSTTTALPASTTSTSQPAPSTSVTATPTASASISNDSGDRVPPAGIAVAVIMSLLILALTAWLIFKYHPKCQAWWTARQERQYRERSHRDALDRPTARSNNPREQALDSGVSRRATMLKSFFAPATVRLGGGQEIRRKPVNWGATSPTMTGTERDIDADGEKIPMTSSAAPMGQIERFSMFPKSKQDRDQNQNQNQVHELPADMGTITTSTPAPISPVSLRPKPSLSSLPPVSPLSTHARGRSSAAATEAELPSLPPIPTLPPLTHAKRGSDGVFRLN